MGTAEAVATQLGIDAKANDDRLDAKLRDELNAVESVLGDELRAEHLKTQEAFVELTVVALGAVEAALAWQLGQRSHPAFRTQ